MPEHEFKIVPRTEIGLPAQVLSSTGRPRPRLSECSFMTIHWPGVDAIYGDVGDTAAEILAIQNYAVYSAKPFMYNYMIGQDEDPFIHEYAGEFRAAHSAGENGDAIGVQLMNGFEEPITDTQVRKIQWLRGVLLWNKVLRQGVLTRPHKGMPGAETTCPGPFTMARWEEILQDYVPPTETPEVPVEEELEHLTHGLHFVQPGHSPWKIAMQYYGTGTRWPEIVEANAPDTVMNPGERWIVPKIKGINIEVLPGEGPWAIIRRAGQMPSAQAVKDFYLWNGGEKRTLKPGDEVFIPYNN